MPAWMHWIDWGTVPAWVSALTPLILAGIVTKAINHVGEEIKGAVKPISRRARLVRTLERVRAAQDAAGGKTGPDQHHGGDHGA